MARSKKTSGKTGSTRPAATASAPSKSDTTDVTRADPSPMAGKSGAGGGQAPATPTAKQTKRRPPSRIGPTGKPLDSASASPDGVSASGPVAGAMPKVSRNRKTAETATASQTGAATKTTTGDTTTPTATGAADGSGSDGTPPAVYPTPATQPAPQPRRGGFFPMVLGGLVAGLIGYGVAQYVGPDDWPFARQAAPSEGVSAPIVELQTQIDALRTDLAAATERSGALESELSAVGGKLSDSSAPLVDRIDGLQIATEEVAQRLGALEQTAEAPDQISPAAQEALTTLGTRIDGDIAALRQTSTETASQQDSLRNDLSALGARVERLESGLESRLAEVAEVRETAEAAEARARRQAALADVQAALNSGAPYQEPISTLAAASEGTEAPQIPEALTVTAQEGVPTLAQLQQEFPDAARSALAASIRATAGSDPVSRLGAFLKTQTGARSLSARDGDDPDAILSRAQDALNQGRVQETLTLLEALPEEGRAEMSAWIAAASDRVAAVAAFDDYSASLTQN